MARYTKLELKEMAKQVKADQEGYGQKSLLFINQLSAITRIPVIDIQNRIDYFSEMKI